MERKHTVEVLGKLNLTASSTFYCFEGIPDTPAIKVYGRINTPTISTNSLAPISKKLSNVSTGSKKSTMSLLGGFSYLSGDSPLPDRPRSKSIPNDCGQPERSDSWKDVTKADKSRAKYKLRRRPGMKIVPRKKESAQFYTTTDEVIPIHLPQSEMFQHFSGMPPDPDVMMEGYLYKRSSNAFKTWNRRWFQIKDNKLAARPSSSSKSDNRSVTAPVGGVPHIGAVSSPTVSDSATTFEQIRRVPGNERCADCGSEQPKWVSINLGVVLCIECSGVHRSLGVQTSKVRSLTMDSIDPELRDVLLSLGNSQVNAIYLAHLPDKDVVPPPATDNSSRQIREAWIKAKYVERRFAVSSSDRARSNAMVRKEHLLSRHRLNVCSPGSGVPRSASYVDVMDADSVRDGEINAGVNGIRLKRLSSCGSDPSLAKCDFSVESNDRDIISESARCGDVLGLLRSLAGGADINSARSGTTALHIATKNGQTAAVEFLLLNGAKINVLDDKLNTPLHLAAAKGNTLQVCQLLKRGADKSLKNADGVTPLEIAVEGKHADIVTLFRVHTMRDEFNEEFNNPMDDTVDSVISDITRKAAEATDCEHIGKKN
ncbi:ankyrin repeat protein [Teladorsagia circumcincta]|uniref:Ankyrin repeat protein n=1 Tax=Teladorsagia circumcincta TaxID=45464 RepID=A0A2G9V028_TELCI|nr:ankyrin repeat protein [Teladorsagia circumcincta]